MNLHSKAIPGESELTSRGQPTVLSSDSVRCLVDYTECHPPGSCFPPCLFTGWNLPALDILPSELASACFHVQTAETWGHKSPKLGLWKSLSHVHLFATPWTVVCQAPLSPWNSPGKNTGVGSFSLLQGIFPTQELNHGLPHCRQILYHLSQQGSPRILKWVAYLFFRGSSWPRNWTGVSCIAGRFFTIWATREALRNSNWAPSPPHLAAWLWAGHSDAGTSFRRAVDRIR